MHFGYKPRTILVRGLRYTQTNRPPVLYSRRLQVLAKWPDGSAHWHNVDEFSNANQIDILSIPRGAVRVLPDIVAATGAVAGVIPTDARPASTPAATTTAAAVLTASTGAAVQELPCSSGEYSVTSANSISNASDTKETLSAGYPSWFEPGTGSDSE